MVTSSCKERPGSGYLGDQHSSRHPRARHSVFVSHGLADELLRAFRTKARLAVVIGRLWELKTIACELFDDVSVEFEMDPEAEDSPLLVLNVTASGDVKEIAARRQEWHRRTHRILGDKCDLVGLIIDVK